VRGPISSAAYLVATLLASSCGPAPCDETRALKIVQDEILSDGRRLEEYELAVIRKTRDMWYVGMAQKINTFYHRRYLIDAKNCKIRELVVDQ